MNLELSIRISTVRGGRSKGPPSGKRDGVIGHISRRENVNVDEKIALLRDTSILYPASLGKLGVNVNFRYLWA